MHRDEFIAARITCRYSNDQVGVPWTKSAGGPLPSSMKCMRPSRRSTHLEVNGYSVRSSQSGTWSGMRDRSGTLFLVEFSPSAKVVEVHDGVEHEPVCADRRSAPERIVRKEDDVTALHRNIHNDRPLGDVSAAIEQPRHKQVALFAESQDDTRALFGRNELRRVTQHVIGHRTGLPWLDGDTWWKRETLLHRRPTLHNVHVVRRSTAGRALGWTSTTRSATTARDADTEAFTATAVDRQAVLDAVGDRTGIINKA